MIRTLLATLTLVLVLPVLGTAQDVIQSALSAGPPSVANGASVMDWNLNVLRPGTNGWTCLPDNAATPGADPWCVNEPWLNFLKAYMSKTKPTYSSVGVAYMLQGDTPVSNTDPYATQFTNEADWVENLGPHLMILVPDHTMFQGISREPNNGGPWIMWPDTPYAHLMIPLKHGPR